MPSTSVDGGLDLEEAKREEKDLFSFQFDVDELNQVFHHDFPISTFVFPHRLFWKFTVSF